MQIINKSDTNYFSTNSPTTMADQENCSLCNNSLCWSDDKLEEYLYYTQVSSFELILILINTLLIVGGIAGNILVCLSVATASNLQTIVNMFLVNLAIADILVLLVCTPFSILQDVTNTWLFGSVFCRLVVFVQTVSMSVSVLTLTAVAYDRYQAICRPLSALAYKKQRVIILLVLIWSISFFISLPEAFILSAVPFLNDRSLFPCVVEDIFWDLSYCVPFWSNTSGFIYTSIKAIFLYLLPLIVMVIVYRNIIKTLWSTNVQVAVPCQENPQWRKSNNKSEKKNSIFKCWINVNSNTRTRSNSAHGEKRRKAALMLMALVVVFFIANLPVHVFNIIIHLNLEYIPSIYRSTVNKVLTHSMVVAHTMCYINSAINPLIYYFMSQAFKKQFQALLSCHYRKDVDKDRSTHARQDSRTFSTLSGQSGVHSTLSGQSGVHSTLSGQSGVQARFKNCSATILRSSKI